MTIVFILFAIFILLFGSVIFFGAPYLPTLKKQQKTAFELLNLKPGQTLVELGSGDGRMLLAAAKKGIKVTGFELNPLLALLSWLITLKYRKLVTVKCKNYWNVKLPKCDGIYVFLLDKYMKKLDKKITQEKHNSVRLVSFAFKIPNKATKTEKNGLFLYIYND